MSSKQWVAAEAKCYADIDGGRLPALILETRFTSRGDYEQTRLRIAVPNQMTGGYLVADYPKPVQSYKLTRRTNTIPELDRGNNDPGPQAA